MWSIIEATIIRTISKSVKVKNMAELSSQLSIMECQTSQESKTKMACQTVIVYGSTPVAWELLLELHKRNLQPLFLSTNEILPAYWCGQVEELDLLRLKLDEAKIVKVLDNLNLKIQYREHDQLFQVKTSKGEFIGMCLVICSEHAIKEYRPLVDKHRGLFTCGVSKKIADTVEDVEFHLNLTTELLRSSVVESPKIDPKTTTPTTTTTTTTTTNEQIITLEPQPSRKLVCCC